LVSISPDELAIELLNQSLRGNAHSPDLLETLVRMALSDNRELARKASHSLFRIVVERLGDLFEPCLCDAYAALFSEVIEQAIPQLDAPALLDRYRRVRMPRRFEAPPERVGRVFVLSRVTLGADVAITSQALDAAKNRFPKAEIVFVGPRKNFELFAADARLRLLETAYHREGTLEERLAVYEPLCDAFSQPGSLVIDPDSRLSQLGMLPLCEEERYFFFESRSVGGLGTETLSSLTRRWLTETFSLERTTPYIAVRDSGPAAAITVSLGVGENPAKRLGDGFERNLMVELSGLGVPVLADRGGSSEEASRTDRAIRSLPNVHPWTGAFAPFASSIASAKLYCGYDSAGQHVAAACGTPLLVIFAGHVSARMFHRWRPEGPGPIHVVRADAPDPELVLRQVRESLPALFA
jgi:hypothetical protein